MEELMQIKNGMGIEADFDIITKIWDINKVIWIYIVCLTVLFESIWVAIKAYRGRRA
ncbi:hypothetical protein D3C71_1955480 [compost metagenome]